MALAAAATAVAMKRTALVSFAFRQGGGMREINQKS